MPDSNTLMTDTTKPMIQPSTLLEVRIAPSATPTAITPPVAIRRINTRSARYRLRPRLGSMLSLDEEAPVEPLAGALPVLTDIGFPGPDRRETISIGRVRMGRPIASIVAARTGPA